MMQNHPNCCNDNCNHGRDCPVRAGTHKHADGLHQIQEPANLPQWLINKIDNYGSAIRNGDRMWKSCIAELNAAIKQCAA